jgi:hypothetical protein
MDSLSQIAVPAYFLLTHAIELTPEAYMRGAGLTVGRLRDVGHELGAPVAKANELGLAWRISTLLVQRIMKYLLSW